MNEALLQFAAGCQTKGITFIPPWYKYIDRNEVDGRCELNFAFPNDISAILLAVIEIMLRVGAFAAIGFVIYGGFMYMTSQGEPDKAANAQKTIVNAIIGLVVTIIATGVISFIGGQLT